MSLALVSQTLRPSTRHSSLVLVSQLLTPCANQSSLALVGLQLTRCAHALQHDVTIPLSVCILYLLISIGCEKCALSFFLPVSSNSIALHLHMDEVMSLSLLFLGITTRAYVIMFWLMVQSMTPIFFDVTLRPWSAVPDNWMDHTAFRRVWRLVLDFSSAHLHLGQRLKMFGSVSVFRLQDFTTRTDTTLSFTATV